MNASGNHQPASHPTQDLAEAGQYFRYMAGYVGFTAADAELIRQTRPIIAKHMPRIVADFYTHLLRYPLTRSLFRMRHLSSFWLRTAEGVYDDTYAGYVDNAARAHTSRGADPNIYVPERYVIGQVGMIQHAISQAVSSELRGRDDDLEFRAGEAWDKLMMVLLELMARAYGDDRQPEPYSELVPVDSDWVQSLARQAIEMQLGDAGARPVRRIEVAKIAEIPDGQRKIVQVDGLSIGVFHHGGDWYAYRNSCVHQGGPVATGLLEGDVLICPWHGYKYSVRSGRSLNEPDAALDGFAVTVTGDTVFLDVPEKSPVATAPQPAGSVPLQANEFRTADLAEGQTLTLAVGDQSILVSNVDGAFYATDEACTHAQGPLSAGPLEGKIVTCVLHGSCFDVTNGAVTCGPATEPLKTYDVAIEGEIGRVTVA